MCRYILIGIVVAIVLLMAVAGVVVSLYGWPGFLVLLASLVVLAAAALFVGPRLFPRFLLGTIARPMRKMGKVLRGATLTVHSVTPAERPEMPGDDEADGDDEPHRIGDRETDDGRPSHRLGRRDGDDEDDEDEEVADDDDEPSPANLDWYWIDFTVTPRDAGSSEGRMVHRTAWNPGLLTFSVPKADRPRATGLPAFFEQFAPGEVLMNEMQVWDGAAEVEMDAETFGAARLRARVGVGRKIGTLLLVYAHFTEVGEIRIPRIDVTPGRES
ncbi:MAG TPA: hypothetical protein VM597_32515 [Gemmataceae bacterium]|nr:hypothetical protein [Gemmataceae bacterium]